MNVIFRKRGRTLEDESSEFMPLSKRINNLHLNGLSGVQDASVVAAAAAAAAAAGMVKMDSDWGTSTFVPSPNHSEPSQGSSSCDGFSSNQSNYEYRPDLDSTENPFYYETNKLLYSLYAERMQRAGGQLY